jgi:CelD/BcsL family acetyltransferase involved in cellulose biosynthesis
LSLQVLTSSQELADIADEWDELAGSSGRPMDSSVWHRNAAQAIHWSDALHVIALWRGGALVALAPLVLTHRSTGLRYEIIGSRKLYEPASVLSLDVAAAKEIAAEMTSLLRPVVLTRMPAESAFGSEFQALARRRGISMSPAASGSQWVDLHQGWDTYCAALSSRLKDMARRGQRQLAKLGSLKFDCIRPDAEASQRLLEQAFSVEMRGWKARAGSAVLLREDLRGFFFAYGRELAGRGELYISSLRLAGEPIAMQVANVSHGAYWLLKIGYDERFAKYRTGLQLQMESLRWAFEQGLERYEFLGSEERWIQEWTQQAHRYATSLFYPYTAASLGALLRDSCDRVVRRLKSSAPMVARL